MNVADAEKTVRILQLMMQHELELSVLYRTCALQWPSEASFWQGLADTEIRHAQTMTKIAAMLTKNPLRFETGRPFNVQSLNTILAGVKEIEARLLQHDIPLEKMLVIARDMEQSLLEARYMDIVKTNDAEYHTLMRAVVAETYEHRKTIEKKMADMGRPG